MAKVEIYTTKYCSYCIRARMLLKHKGVEFDETDVGNRPDLREWLIERTGRHTVPQVFINGESVGGYDDIAALDRAGKLAPMLAAPRA